VFRTTSGYVIALTYGVAEWTRNVTAAGGCDLLTRGRRVHLTDPRLVVDRTRADIPAVPRRLLRWFGVDQFLYLRSTSGVHLGR
jgi:hypothetical protein